MTPPPRPRCFKPSAGWLMCTDVLGHPGNCNPGVMDFDAAWELHARWLIYDTPLQIIRDYWWPWSELPDWEDRA